MVMFCFDVESMDTGERCVVLSAGIIAFDRDSTPESMLRDSLFVKFDAKEQAREFKRTIDKGTMEWWNKQSIYCKKKSCLPSTSDVDAKTGIQQIKDFMSKFDPNGKAIVWVRGSLDQFAIDSLADDAGIEYIAGYNVYRDVRTAIDVLYGTGNGYCQIDYDGFNRDDYAKHDPVNDCLIDAMMLLYGKENDASV